MYSILTPDPEEKASSENSLPPERPRCEYGGRVSVSVVEASEADLACSYAGATLLVPFAHLTDFREISDCGKAHRAVTCGAEMEMTFLGWSRKNKRQCILSIWGRFAGVVGPAIDC